MTKIAIFVFVTLATAGLSPAQTAAPASQKKAATTQKATAQKTAARSAPVPPGVPAGSTPLKPYYWRFVDKKGVAWIYHETPFGVVHDEETEADRAERGVATVKDDAVSELIVVDKGNELEFARQTPFGRSVWVSNKATLTEEEAAAWAKSKARAAQARGQQ